MNVLTAIIQLKDDLKLWGTNNLKEKMDKDGILDCIRFKDENTGKIVIVELNNGKLVYYYDLCEDDLIDFTYIKNADGTYTLTGWKGTLNGVPSTEIVVPNHRKVIV